VLLPALAVFYAASKLLAFAASPGTWCGALVVLGVLAALARRPRLAAATALLGVASFVAFSSPVVAEGLQHRVESLAPRTYRPGEPYDAIVILSGDPSRLEAAGEAVRTGRVANVLYSGRVSPSRAQLIAREIRGWGVPDGRFVIEASSRNTRENATESARIAADRGWRRIAVVTNAVHVPRALGCFRAAGIEPDVLPVPLPPDAPSVRGTWRPSAAALDRSAIVLHEVVGLAVYRVLGYAR
jgi:uncharacterized SAM-binding protein YcdF (DUF218 family)